jgi:hypothetical protein
MVSGRIIGPWWRRTMAWGRFETVACGSLPTNLFREVRQRFLRVAAAGGSPTLGAIHKLMASPHLRHLLSGPRRSRREA